MGWLRGSFDQLEGRLLEALQAEAAAAAAADGNNGAHFEGATSAAPQAPADLPPCVQRYLQFTDAASCNYT